MDLQTKSSEYAIIPQKVLNLIIYGSEKVGKKTLICQFRNFSKLPLNFLHNITNNDIIEAIGLHNNISIKITFHIVNNIENLTNFCCKLINPFIFIIYSTYNEHFFKDLNENITHLLKCKRKYLIRNIIGSILNKDNCGFNSVVQNFCNVSEFNAFEFNFFDKNEEKSIFFREIENSLISGT